MASVLVPVVLAAPSPAAASTVPSGFQEQVVFSGLVNPTNIEFASDGRVFVLEKSGKIKIFDNLADTTPTVFADLSGEVMDYWDRGALGLALDPNFPASPYVYVSYTLDAGPGQTPPVWNDACADPTGQGCVVTSRVSRLTAVGNTMSGPEQVLLTDWCQQFPSHSIGDLHFGLDGMLYVTGGDGASFNYVDYGQTGNPCGDPNLEGGALRSQDVRSTGDPTSLDGTLLRIDPATGAAAPGNPNIGSSDLNTRRIVALGMRNPFRFTVRPGTNEVWIGDVGWNTWEEIDRVTNPTGPMPNFGWPCFEGNATQSGYQGANLPLCQSLSSQTAPYYTYNHSSTVVSGEACPTGGSSITGVSFYPTSGGSYPAAYAGALFFADYSRNCIWAMRPTTAGGLPSPSNIVTFASGAANPVDLNVGPGGELYYADLGGGTIRRIRYLAGNQPPSASLVATPTSGPAPLTVQFNASGSSDPDPADQGRLTYQWDFTNDGIVDATTATAAFTYTTAGTRTARLTVTDTLGATDTKTVVIQVGTSAPPVVTIATPAAGTTWKVGDTIAFSGSATDAQGAAIPASGLSWQLQLQHCAPNQTCHVHVIQTWTGVSGGSFTAPDHEYPSYLELSLTATDSNGNSSTLVRRLDPQTVALSFATNPSGLRLAVGSTAEATPFTRTVIVGSAVSVSAPTPQTTGGTTYSYSSWSDGGAQSHVITAGPAPATYTATYTGAPACVDSFGYVCTDGPRTFVPADQTVLTLTGDDAVQQISLPFAFPFYGGTSTSAWVDTNGVVSFAAPPGSAWNHGAIPSAAATAKTNLAAYPFWDDLWVDAQSSVRTASSGTAPNRQFIIEWRNARFYDDAARVSFEVILAENGTITFAYKDIDPTSTRERGGTATVGIENGNGTVALQYSLNRPVLVSGNGVTFAPPGAPPPPPPPPPPSTGTVTGTVTDAGAPVAGVTVRLNPTLTATTAANGTYTISSVPVGSYTATAALPATGCGTKAGSTPVTVTSGTTSTANIAVVAAPVSDAFGYTCTVGTTAYVAASTVVALTGDDAITQITLPFPIRFYGVTYTTAWLDTNGVMSFAAPPGSAWDHGAIPSAAAPNRSNLALYPFWDDLLVDSSASIRTMVTGTAPNRQFVVEWRNLRTYDDPNVRVDFEVIFNEGSGAITFTYNNIANVAREQGGQATVGIENVDGTIALQFSLNQPVLRSGTSITFLPPT